MSSVADLGVLGRGVTTCFVYVISSCGEPDETTTDGRTKT